MNYTAQLYVAGWLKNKRMVIGKYTIQTELKDGTVETVINLTQISGGSNVSVYAAVGLLSLSGLAMMIKKRS